MTSSATELSRAELAGLWLLAAAIAVPLGVWALQRLGDTDVPSSGAFVEYNEPRIEAFAERLEAGANGVVLLGDSRMRNATPGQDDLAARLATETGADVAVLRLIHDAAILDDFERVRPLLVEAGPNLVIFQEELRGRSRTIEGDEILKREYLWWNVYGRGAWNPGRVDQDYLQTSTDCWPEEGVAERQDRIGQWVTLENAEGLGRLASFVADLESAGSEVRFLDIPITTAAAAGMPMIDRTVGSAALGPDTDVAIDDGDFCDVVHMGPSGRDLYSNWLVGALAAEPTLTTR